MSDKQFLSRSHRLTREETVEMLIYALDARLWKTPDGDLQLRLFSRYEAETIMDALKAARPEKSRSLKDATLAELEQANEGGPVAAIDAVLRDPMWGLGNVPHEQLARAILQVVEGETSSAPSETKRPEHATWNAAMERAAEICDANLSDDPIGKFGVAECARDIRAAKLPLPTPQPGMTFPPRDDKNSRAAALDAKHQAEWNAQVYPIDEAACISAKHCDAFRMLAYQLERELKAALSATQQAVPFRAALIAEDKGWGDNDALDAARYRWLRIRGCAIDGTEQQRDGLVRRCVNLDEQVDSLRSSEGRTA